MRNYIFVQLTLIPILVLISETRQTSIHPSVKLCKRNDAISDCYCDNFRRMIPILKNGAPKMHIPPLDPIYVLNVVLDLTHMQPLHLFVNLYNISVRGFAHTNVPYCDLSLNESGIVKHLRLEIPLLSLDATYDMIGTFGNFALNSTGDCHSELGGIFVNTTWTGVEYSRDGQTHLGFECTFDDFEFRQLKMHFSKIFENNPQMDDVFNAAIDNYMDAIIREIEPIGLNIIKTIAVQVIDAIYETFPYDVLYPLD